MLPLFLVLAGALLIELWAPLGFLALVLALAVLGAPKQALPSKHEPNEEIRD
jgi:hypothetical protein